MRNYTVESPTFTKAISIVEEDDLVNEENDTAAAKQLIGNDLVLNDRMERCLGKDPAHGDSKNLIITFESGDAASATAWTNVDVMQSKEEHKSLFGKISTMMKNVRYLYRLLGTTDISSIGDGTITDAIKKLKEDQPGDATQSVHGLMTAIDKAKLDGIDNGANAYTHPQTHDASMIGQNETHRFVSDIEKNTWNNKLNKSDVSRSTAVTVEGQKALDAIENNAAVPGTLAHNLAQINSKLSTISNISTYGESLNDFWQEGKTLYCWVDTLTQEGINRSNTPAAGSFMVTSMAVFGSTRTVQIATQVYHGYGAGDMYVRSKHDASWSSWQRLVTDSRLPAINGAPLTFIEENVSDYGVSHHTINGVTYGKLCLINYMFGVKDGMSPWEIRYIATGAPVPAWIGISFWGNPVIAGGSCNGNVSAEVDGEGRFLIHCQEHALSNNNWLIGTLVYFIS